MVSFVARQICVPTGSFPALYVSIPLQGKFSLKYMNSIYTLFLSLLHTHSLSYLESWTQYEWTLSTPLKGSLSQSRQFFPFFDNRFFMDSPSYFGYFPGMFNNCFSLLSFIAVLAVLRLHPRPLLLSLYT